MKNKYACWWGGSHTFTSRRGFPNLCRFWKHELVATLSQLADGGCGKTQGNMGDCKGSDKECPPHKNIKKQVWRPKFQQIYFWMYLSHGFTQWNHSRSSDWFMIFHNLMHFTRYWATFSHYIPIQSLWQRRGSHETCNQNASIWHQLFCSVFFTSILCQGWLHPTHRMKIFHFSFPKGTLLPWRIYPQRNMPKKSVNCETWLAEIESTCTAVWLS